MAFYTSIASMAFHFIKLVLLRNVIFVLYFNCFFFLLVIVLVTILCGFFTLSAQETGHHDTESCITGQKGKPKDHHLHCCGNLTYNILGSSCCNDVINHTLSQLVADCCESVAFNPLNEICCGGNILTRNNAQAECCGSEMYLSTTHVCCGDKTFELNKKDLSCCGNQSFDKATHFCDATHNPQVKPKTDANSTEPKREMCPLTNVLDLKCGNDTYDPLKKICCSGKLYNSSSTLYKCCGESAYKISDKVLCCNGRLHSNVPENSECFGDVMYADQQLQMRCGSKVYNPHNKSMRCCSGHLHNITTVVGKAECCGIHLLEERKNQTCCSSTSHAMLYETKPNHSCCGHYYYNTSLWSCCAGHLKPTPENANSTAGYRLKPLIDLFPDICEKTVVFGKVESVGRFKDQRLVLLRVLVEYNVSKQFINDFFTFTSLDHCSSPALEDGMIYLWEKKNNKKYNPRSLPIELTSDIYMFLALCEAKTMNSTE